MPAVLPSRPSMPIARPIDVAQRRLRRLEMLERLLARWQAAPSAPASPAAATRETLARWLDRADPALRPDLFASLAGALDASDARSADPDRVAACFASALLDQAKSEVAREAQRAGHGEVHAALAPWIERGTEALPWDELSTRLARSPAALRTALERLRRRFRQRVEAWLALWADTPEARTTLRRRLRSALNEGTESTP